MSFEIEIQDTFSLNDVLHLVRTMSPDTVCKTPHVGNHYLNNLAMGFLGIPMRLVDTNVGKKDVNFHPHCLIVDGRREIMGDPNLLMPQNCVCCKPNQFSERFPLGGLIQDGHISSLQEVFPKTSIQGNLAFLRKHAEVSEMTCLLFAELFPFLWKRSVNEFGSTSVDLPFLGASSLKHLGIMGLTNLKKGWIIPNQIGIFLDVLIPALKGDFVVYQLSGPDMYRYISGYLTVFQEMYEAVRVSLYSQLPETVRFVCIPVADMRFVVQKERRMFLDELIEAVCAYEFFEQEKSMVFVRGSSEDKEKQIATFRERGRVHTEHLYRAIGALPEIFYEISDGTYLSQYDLLLNKEQGTPTDELLYIHPNRVASDHDIGRVLFSFFYSLKPNI